MCKFGSCINVIKKNNMIEIDPENLDLTKVLIEKEKLRIELEKLKLEKSKKTWSIFASLVPILAIILTIFYGIYTQQENEKNMFQIKAAEIMFNSADRIESKENANILKELFPDKLPKDFSESFELYPFDYHETNSKKDLLKLLTSDKEKNKEIILNWKKLFPDDKWIDDLLK
jgi:hypothetical protein